MRYVLVALVVGLAPAAATAQTLGPRTLLPFHVACADIPVSVVPPASLTIAGTERADGRESLGAGEVAVIKAGTAQGLAVGQQFVVRRMDGGTESFRRGVAGLGGVRTNGVVVITAVDADFALARVERACADIQVGDYLEPLTMPALPAVAAAGAPDFADRAMVLFGRDLTQSFGDGDVLAIDRGTSHGVTPGSRFVIYRDGRQGLPLKELGEVVVVDVGETSSRGVVTRVTDVITSGDLAVRRAPVQP